MVGNEVSQTCLTLAVESEQLLERELLDADEVAFWNDGLLLIVEGNDLAILHPLEFLTKFLVHRTIHAVHMMTLPHKHELRVQVKVTHKVCKEICLYVRRKQTRPRLELIVKVQDKLYIEFDENNV